MQFGSSSFFASMPVLKRPAAMERVLKRPATMKAECVQVVGTQAPVALTIFAKLNG